MAQRRAVRVPNAPASASKPSSSAFAREKQSQGPDILPNKFVQAMQEIEPGVQYTFTQAAEKAGVSRTSLCKLAARKKLAFTRKEGDGHNIKLVSGAELIRLLESLSDFPIHAVPAKAACVELGVEYTDFMSHWVRKDERKKRWVEYLDEDGNVAPERVYSDLSSHRYFLSRQGLDCLRASQINWVGKQTAAELLGMSEESFKEYYNSKEKGRVYSVYLPDWSVFNVRARVFRGEVVYSRPDCVEYSRSKAEMLANRVGLDEVARECGYHPQILMKKIEHRQDGSLVFCPWPGCPKSFPVMQAPSRKFFFTRSDAKEIRVLYKARAARAQKFKQQNISLKELAKKLHREYAWLKSLVVSSTHGKYVKLSVEGLPKFYFLNETTQGGLYMNRAEAAALIAYNDSLRAVGLELRRA